MKHVLITNQHGENRGDESALRGLLHTVSNKLGAVRFTVIAQIQDTSIDMKFEQDVSLLHMKMSILSFAGLVTYSLLKKVRISLPFLLTDCTQHMMDAYRDCDVVVSAPGGPYFGDIYANHEIMHWFYIWLGLLFEKPLFLYAPSAGPFEIYWLNIIRKRLLKKFDVLCLREEISKEFLENLIGTDKEIHVTADSSIQQMVHPMSREDYFVGERQPYRERFLVAVSVIEYPFPGDPDPDGRQKEYAELILEMLKHLSLKKRCHFLFIPQLYGQVHSDVPYLEHLSSSLSGDATREIVDPTLDSNSQRAIFAMCELCIASRYHPQVFAGTSAVPGVCIYYEHKALGFMKAMGLEDFAFDIRGLRLPPILAKLDEAVDQRDKLIAIMKQKVIPVRERSAHTTDLLVELLEAKQR
jgi:polysaccharide pyruvyl transferase WcaK-like protein